MAYNSNKGNQHTGDIQFEGDPNDTQIDFENDSIKLKTGTGAVTRLEVNNNHVSASGNVSGSAFYSANTVMNEVHVSSSLNISGSDFYASGVKLEPTPLTSYTNATAEGSPRLVTSTNSSTINGQANLTFDGSNLKLNGSGHITGSLELTGSGQSLLTLHTRDEDSLKEIAFLKDGNPAAAIQINSAEHLFIENENTKDIILRTNNQNALRIIGSQRRVIVGNVSRTAANAQLDVEGSAIVSGSLTATTTVAVGGNHLDGVLNISGSTAETLISAKSDTAQNAFTLKGNGDVSISGSLTVTGSLRAKQLHITTHKWAPGSGGRVYLRFNVTGSDGAAGDDNKMIAPYNGKLIKVMVRGTAAGGSTDVALHTAPSETQNVGTIEEAITRNMAGANVSYTFTFTSAASYTAGEIVGLSVVPSDDPGSVVATAIWEFDENSAG